MNPMTNITQGVKIFSQLYTTKKIYFGKQMFSYFKNMILNKKKRAFFIFLKIIKVFSLLCN